MSPNRSAPSLQFLEKIKPFGALHIGIPIVRHTYVNMWALFTYDSTWGHDFLPHFGCHAFKAEQESTLPETTRDTLPDTVPATESELELRSVGTPRSYSISQHLRTDMNSELLVFLDSCWFMLVRKMPPFWNRSRSWKLQMIVRLRVNAMKDLKAPRHLRVLLVPLQKPLHPPEPLQWLVQFLQWPLQELDPGKNLMMMMIRLSFWGYTCIACCNRQTKFTFPYHPNGAYISWEASGEKIYMDDQGRLCCNGKPMTEAAIDQRLRRWCTKRKNGSLKCSQEVYDRYHNLGNDARLELIQVFKNAGLNKDPSGIKSCAIVQWCSLLVPNPSKPSMPPVALCCCRMSASAKCANWWQRRPARP